MITEDRIHHIMSVARLMKENAEQHGLDSQEMFTLGMLHDIGYEFGDSEQHHLLGAEVLEKQGYKYYREVLFHGKPDVGYESPALDLLNFADMKVDKKGNVVSFEERLKDIMSRRGADSPHYKNCKKIIEGLKAKGFTDNEKGFSND